MCTDNFIENKDVGSNPSITSSGKLYENIRE